MSRIMKCPICSGSGKLHKERFLPSGSSYLVEEKCPACLGKKQVLICEIPDNTRTLNQAVELVIDGKPVIGVPVEFRKGGPVEN